VQAADLSYKRTNELALGDSSVGIDVDDFVSKCLSFMRRGDGANGQVAAPNGTQSQRRRRNALDDDEENDEQLNWAHLGRRACFPYNARPCVPTFLLGPLSVQKRTRHQTQRRAREARANLANATRPQELLEEDLEKQETANLTVVCKEIERLLGGIQSKGWEACEKEQDERDDMTEQEAMEMMLSHGISDDGCVPLFDFCVNPKSFGQTVENLFYISFLIKEGSVGLNFDSRGLPTLGCAGKEPAEAQQAKGSARNQAVFALDFETWEAIIESHGIKKSLIPHRQEGVFEDGVLGSTGWYG
jgi:non-structural maintenance of chromosomes element 4